MFEKAARLKLRFETVKGQVTVEDLWDMPLVSREISSPGFSLDEMAIAINGKLKIKQESFVTPLTCDDSILSLKLDILKRVIEIKMKEAKDNEEVVVKKARKEYILSIIKEKQTEALRDKSIEELEKELDSL